MSHITREAVDTLLARVARLQVERRDAARRGHKAVINSANYNLLRELDALAKALHALATENEALGRAASEVMTALQAHGASIVPHLLDTDDNAGQRLRHLLNAAQEGA